MRGMSDLLNKKRAVLTIALVMVAVISMVVLAGCHEKQSTYESSDFGIGTPPLMPATDHIGRWEKLGVKGCFGCHGSNDRSGKNNGTAPSMPDDHYVDQKTETFEIDPYHLQCVQCHPLAVSE